MQNFGEFDLKVAESGDPSDMMAYTTAETAAVDAALKKVRSQAYQADAGKVSKGGDTMSGTLQIRTPAHINAQLHLGAGARAAWVLEGNTGGDFAIGQVGHPPAAITIQDISHQVAVDNDLTVGRNLTVTGNLTIRTIPGSGINVGPDTSTGMLWTNGGVVSNMGSAQLKNTIAWVQASTRRWKTGITVVQAPDVAGLRPVTFRYAEDSPLGNDDQREHLGLIAEDVAEVDPRFATYVEGRVHGLDHSALIAALVDKVQKLEARIEALEGGV